MPLKTQSFKLQQRGRSLTCAIDNVDGSSRLAALRFGTARRVGGSLGRTPCIGMVEEASSGFFDSTSVANASSGSLRMTDLDDRFGGDLFRGIFLLLRRRNPGLKSRARGRSFTKRGKTEPRHPSTPGASPGVSFCRAEAARNGSPAGLPRGGSARPQVFSGCVAPYGDGTTESHTLLREFPLEESTVNGGGI